MDHIVGMLWNRNEGDILEEIITNLLPNVDSLFIADDGSTDASWKIIKEMRGLYKKIEHIQQKPDRQDQGQRQSLLDEIRNRYKPENTIVQVCESDISLLDTDIRRSWTTHSNSDIFMKYLLLNAVRKPGTWKEVDTYPKWNDSIRNIMPYCHRLEEMTYAFRPLPGLKYNQTIWRPWPAGFKQYLGNDSGAAKSGRWRPLLIHYGYRGPTHFYNKYKSMGKHHVKYPSWDLTSPESVERTVSFFNGDWNKDEHTFPISRYGIINYTRGKDHGK